MSGKRTAEDERRNLPAYMDQRHDRPKSLSDGPARVESTTAGQMIERKAVLTAIEKRLHFASTNISHFSEIGDYGRFQLEQARYTELDEIRQAIANGEHVKAGASER